MHRSGGYNTSVSWMQVPGTHSTLSMLVPRLDLANHSFDANADWTLDFSGGILKLTATQDLAQNEPVSIDYGPSLDNAHLMRVFGFAIPGNPNDRLAFLEQQSKAAINNLHPPSMSQHQQPAHSLLPHIFCKAAALDSDVSPYEQKSWTHDGQGIVSCHEDANLSRRFSAMLSLPGCAAEQFWPGPDYGQVPSQSKQLYMPPKCVIIHANRVHEVYTVSELAAAAAAALF